ncbi:hypothetical protein, partial [Nocardia cyriacigeorgica]|uniref:hypothetical protein n=1 Tax=Nocardia cyriacigeorgica TaxID=135487 RepID=UPI002453F4C1
GAAVDPGPEDHGIDEHADHVVELAHTAPGDRGAGRDVVHPPQPRQPYEPARPSDLPGPRLCGSADRGVVMHPASSALIRCAGGTSVVALVDVAETPAYPPLP